LQNKGDTFNREQSHSQAGTLLAVSAALATFHPLSQGRVLGAQAGVYEAAFLTLVHALPNVAA